MPPCDPNLSQPLGNHRSLTSRVASAAGRLRSYEQLGSYSGQEVPSCETEGLRYAPLVCAYLGRLRPNQTLRLPLARARTVQKPYLFHRLGLALSEKQMPRFVGNINI